MFGRENKNFIKDQFSDFKRKPIPKKVDNSQDFPKCEDGVCFFNESNPKSLEYKNQQIKIKVHKSNTENDTKDYYVVDNKHKNTSFLKLEDLYRSYQNSTDEKYREFILNILNSCSNLDTHIFNSIWEHKKFVPYFSDIGTSSNNSFSKIEITEDNSVKIKELYVESLFITPELVLYPLGNTNFPYSLNMEELELDVFLIYTSDFSNKELIDSINKEFNIEEEFMIITEKLGVTSYKKIPEIKDLEFSEIKLDINDLVPELDPKFNDIIYDLVNLRNNFIHDDLFDLNKNLIQKFYDFCRNKDLPTEELKQSFINNKKKFIQAEHKYRTKLNEILTEYFNNKLEQYIIDEIIKRIVDLEHDNKSLNLFSDIIGVEMDKSKEIFNVLKQNYFQFTQEKNKTEGLVKKFKIKSFKKEENNFYYDFSDLKLDNVGLFIFKM